MKNLEEEISKDDFWLDQDKANSVCKKLSDIKEEVKEYNSLKDNALMLIELSNEGINDELEKEFSTLKEDVDKYSKKVYLSGKYDGLNCYLEIHPGAGGTESCDWSNMLLDMYINYAEKKNYTYEIISLQKGDEAGIKSVIIYVKGHYAYGYLKNEQGVHRLVRISPFDSNKRRHTSFASVSVTPEFNEDISIEVKEEDLKIDVYHSSGAGGQSVNTSNSAVRITHLPSKIVVTCQTERSQLLNKEKAMKLLVNKLYQIEIEKNKKMLDEVKDESDINFGSQIRSYVLEPYKMVKDHRTNYESSSPDKVFAGELDGFIETMLEKNI